MNKRFNKSFAFTSPYGGGWMEKFYRKFAIDLFGKKVKTEQQFRELTTLQGSSPDLMIFCNFIVERHAIAAVCREYGTDIIHTEDGFFPHYSTIHADPLGFCWESSLPRQIFRKCSDQQRNKAREFRNRWLSHTARILPEVISRPYVLWPLQLIGDRVNMYDLNKSDWRGLLHHFRQSLPTEFKILIKPHPRAKQQDVDGIERLAESMENTMYLKHNVDVKSLLHFAAAVAGANSTVLTEARVMFHKPVYAYARSWFTNHVDLVTPMSDRTGPRQLNRLEWLESPERIRTEYLDDYTDWFLFQLLSRQLDHQQAQNRSSIHCLADRLSYQSYLKYGEEIFDRTEIC